MNNFEKNKEEPENGVGYLFYLYKIDTIMIHVIKKKSMKFASKNLVKLDYKKTPNIKLNSVNNDLKTMNESNLGRSEMKTRENSINFFQRS